jgi:hypothetical protein
MLLYAGTIFLSAFLLFLVQPIIAKQILPWFGGAASVWATCLVFFQSVLLLGYAYADWTSRRMTPRTQAKLHIALLVVSLALLPIIPDARWKPGGEEGAAPMVAILGLLGVTIGLQYFMLSATSPLLQSWYWRHFKTAAPYRLFALSNFASLLALLSYPVVIEPFLRLAVQSYSWSALYAGFAVLCALTAWSSAKVAGAAAPVTPSAVADDADVPAPTWAERLSWVAFSAMGSCLLLAVTNHLTQNIASIPFLWLVPLSLYLVTFIVCFDHPRWYVRPLFIGLVAVALPAMAYFTESLDLYVAAPLYAAGMFLCCMFCHGELYRLRPAPRYLTTFYLMISVGGALGALLIAIVAPLVLKGYYELGFTLIACALLVAWSAMAIQKWAAVIAFAVVCTTSWFVMNNINEYSRDTRVMVRNFYGVVRTRDYTDPVQFRVMYHGAINHGGQLMLPSDQRKPSTYFGPTSGYGRAFASLPEAPRRVGVVGLGAGAIAAYARKGDLFRFYEIDPQVAAVAMTEFTYLKGSPAQIDVVLGDGRLSLEREAPQRYDLLAIDAFAGDSIPMHLLTREAMAAYVKHLAPDGVIVFQATNRFVGIAPVVERLAAAFGMTAVMVSDEPENSYKLGADYWLSSTDQIIVTKSRKILDAEPIRSAADILPLNPKFPLWTDDFYNLLGILKR